MHVTQKRIILLIILGVALLVAGYVSPGLLRSVYLLPLSVLIISAFVAALPPGSTHVARSIRFRFGFVVMLSCLALPIVRVLRLAQPVADHPLSAPIIAALVPSYALLLVAASCFSMWTKAVARIEVGELSPTTKLLAFVFWIMPWAAFAVLSSVAASVLS